MEPEFVDCSNLGMVKAEPQEVEDITENKTGEEDCISETRETTEGGSEPIKPELEDEMHEDGSNSGNLAKNSFVFECTKCNKTYHSSCYLETHSRTCQGLRRQLVKVKPEIFSTDSEILSRIVFKDDSLKMKQHQTDHSGNKAFECAVCGFAFTRASNLRSHMATHTGQKPYTCHQCEYKTARRKDLARHVQAKHTGEKPYSCDHCDFRTSRIGALNRHNLAKHNEEKPYGCDHCEYRTSRSDDLKTHILGKHSEDKPYSCLHCEYKTARSGLLNRHIDVRHGGQVLPSCPLRR